MIEPWLGLIGIAIGVILTNGFQLLGKYIDKKTISLNRWTDDKKSVYAKFIMNASMYFNYSLTIGSRIMPEEANARYIKSINESVLNLNESLSMINVIGGEKVIEQADNLNTWMRETITVINTKGMIDDKTSEALSREYKKMKKQFVATIRLDFPK